MKTFYWIPVLLLCACDPPDEHACAKGSGELKAVVPAINPTMPLEKDLTVTGTIERPPGIAVYDIWVAGVAATGTGLDFSGFSAKVPFDTLVSLATGTPPMATVEITARTNCSVSTASLSSFTVPVNPKPGIKVTRLVFDSALIPNGADYLPADMSASALLRLRANPEAAGATLSLSTSHGTFDGVGTGNVVTLSGDGKTDAVAAFGFRTDKDAQLSASSGGASAATSISVAGAPTLVPADSTILLGQSLRVTVFTDGKLKSCQATPANGISVTSGGTNLMATPGGKDLNADGRIDFDVSVLASDGGSPDGGQATTTVSCIDVFGQFSAATYRAAP
jgi:hypothetical protein